MRDILKMGLEAGELLIARGDSIVVGETSTGGLVSASLLAVPGASAYFAGGAITYAKPSIEAFAGLSVSELQTRGIRSSSESYAQLLAKAVRERCGVTWGLSESGAAGPTKNAHGDPAGHTCLAVSGPVDLVRTLRTDSRDRVENMWLFAEAALGLLLEALRKT